MDAEDLTEEARANPEHLLVESFFHAETTYDVDAESYLAIRSTMKVKELWMLKILLKKPVQILSIFL